MNLLKNIKHLYIIGHRQVPKKQTGLLGLDKNQLPILQSFAASAGTLTFLLFETENMSSDGGFFTFAKSSTAYLLPSKQH